MKCLLVPRVFSALVGVPLIILAVWWGGFALLGFSALVMLLSLREIQRMFRRLALNIPFGLMILGAALLLGSVYLYKDAGLAGAIAIIFFIFLLWFIFFYPKFNLIDMAMALLATSYVGLFVYVYLLRTLPDGWIWVVFMLVGTWLSDTTAFFIGKYFGKRRLARVLSPGKTIEGAIGGAAGSFLAAAAFLYIYPFLPPAPVLVLGLLLGVAAQAGDLVESAFKRQVGVKDAGDLIPGHGGMLDRFDSMLFTAPLVYYYVQKLII
ncbi:MAG: phosphatidate cytidylyltransferase [Bacillota bacterium]